MRQTMNLNHTINLHLREYINSDDADEWDFRKFASEIYDYAEDMISYFSLEIGMPAIAVDKLRKTRLAECNPKRNRVGIPFEITFNSRWMHRKQWRILGTLLHQLLHIWQSTWGKPGNKNYHNKEFREKALQVGLDVQSNGQTFYREDSVFLEFLDLHGVPWELSDEDRLPDDEAPRNRGVLWSCDCRHANVRKAHGIDVHLHCLKCATDFEIIPEEPKVEEYRE